MTKEEEKILKEINGHLLKIRALVPKGSHILLEWGEGVRDKDTVHVTSDPCPICHGKEYIA